MKLGSIRSNSPDGQLVVLSRDLKLAKVVSEIAPTLQNALDRWDDVEDKLQQVSADLNAGKAAGTITYDMKIGRAHV